MSTGCRNQGGQFTSCGRRTGTSGRLAAVSRRRALAQKVNAGNDRNGNPRRGWIVTSSDGKSLGFVVEGYMGDAALRGAFPAARETGRTIMITPGEYRKLAKGAVAGY